jgi:uncharacterized membrane protein YdbT with pleckstrin-like domain
MGYVETVLAPGERVLYTGRLHWVIYGPGFAALGLEVVLIAAELVWPDLGQFANRWAFVCLGAAAVAFAKAWIQQTTTEIAATDRRIIFKTGLIQRRTVEMHLDKVESVDVGQSILGRIFDYGTVIVRGTGAGIEPLSNVAEPLKLRSFVAAA